MSDFKIKKSNIKKKNKIENAEHYDDVHKHPDKDVKIPEDLAHKHTHIKSHFPDHKWPVPNEKKKGPKI